MPCSEKTAFPDILMRLLKYNILFSLLLFFCSQTEAQDYLDKNEYYYSFTNRFDLLVVQDSSASDISLGIVFNIGTYTEGELFEGMSYLFEQLMKTKFESSLREAGLANDSLFSPIHSYTFLEGIYFNFSFPKSHLEKALQAIYFSVTAPVTPEQLTKAAKKANQDYVQLRQDASFSLSDKIMSALWTENYKRRTAVKMWTDSMLAYLPQRFVKMRYTYFCPRNCMIIVKGPVKARELSEFVRKQFVNWEKCEMNPFTRFPAPNYRTTLNSMQLIDENSSTTQAFFQIAFPGPNTYEDRKGNFCALILSSILSSPGSQLNIYLKDSCHISSCKLENDLGKYISQITFTLTPENEHLSDGYECFRSLLLSLDTALLDESELSLGKENLSSSFRQMKKNPEQHIDLIGRYWTSVSLNDYSTFEDSIAAITLQDMRQFIKSYLLSRNYVAGLSVSPEHRKSSGIDSVFTPTAGEVSEYRVYFKTNSALLESAKDDSTINSLIQFLKINPEVKIKVNGVTHKDELLQVYDKTMSAWVRSLGDNFIINPPSLAQKTKFRLDVYRSLTIMRELVGAGIEMERLFGTGQINRSTEGSRDHQKVYCTLIVNY